MSLAITIKPGILFPQKRYVNPVFLAKKKQLLFSRAIEKSVELHSLDYEKSRVFHLGYFWENKNNFYKRKRNEFLIAVSYMRKVRMFNFRTSISDFHIKRLFLYKI